MLSRAEANPIANLSEQTDAARILLATLQDIVADDDALATDMVEAETNLHDAINAAVDLVQQDESHAEAIAERIKALQARADRLKSRARNTRTAIAVAMDVARAKKIITPLGTVSVRKTPEALEVVDESEIPGKYFVVPEPKLSRKAILDDLKGGAEVPGCKLLPAGQTIAIRA